MTKRNITPEVETLRSTVVENVLYYARAANMSRNQLAEHAGVSRSHLFQVLAGRTGCSVDWLARLAPTLGVTPDKLLAPDTAH